MKVKLLVTAMAAALITTAWADDPAKDKGSSKRTADQKFESLDRNDDSRVSRSEAQSDEALSAEFASLDTNADDNLSKSEYTAMSDMPRTQRPSREYSEPRDYSPPPTE